MTGPFWLVFYHYGCGTTCRCVAEENSVANDLDDIRITKDGEVIVDAIFTKKFAELAAQF